jgi:hypothetical protein
VDKIFKILSGVAAVVATLIFFYPTPYSYEDGGLTRINRFTGAVQKASGEGWIAADSGPKDPEDTVTPEIVKALEKVTIVAQDFDSITINNPGPWNLVLIEKGEVSFDKDCGGTTDYVEYLTVDRSWNPGKDIVIKMPHSERFKRNLLTACGGATHHRTVTFIVNSGFTNDKHWDSQTRIVSRKVEGDVAIPKAP